MDNLIYISEQYEGLQLDVFQELPSGWFYHPLLRQIGEPYRDNYNWSSDVLTILKEIINKKGIDWFKNKMKEIEYEK